MYATFALSIHLSCYFSLSPSSGILHTSLHFLDSITNLEEEHSLFLPVKKILKQKVFVELHPPYLRLIDYQDIALRNGNSSCRNLGVNCLNDKHIKLPHDISKVIE